MMQKFARKVSCKAAPSASLGEPVWIWEFDLRREVRNGKM